jgi:hypothetical protein
MKVLEPRLASRRMNMPADFEAVYELVIDAIDCYNAIWEHELSQLIEQRNAGKEKMVSGGEDLGDESEDGLTLRSRSSSIADDLPGSPGRVSTNQHRWVRGGIYVYILTSMNAYIRIDTYLHICSYIHVYLHARISIHTYVWKCVQ